jgi:hypothetical protein
MDDGRGDFPERLAEELDRRLGEDAPIGSEEVALMLRLSRDVAHRTERRWAPVSTYLAGRFVARRTAQGVPLREALAEVEDAAATVLPSEGGAEPDGSPPPPGP